MNMFLENKHYYYLILEFTLSKIPLNATFGFQIFQSTKMLHCVVADKEFGELAAGYKAFSNAGVGWCLIGVVFLSD